MYSYCICSREMHALRSPNVLSSHTNTVVSFLQRCGRLDEGQQAVERGGAGVRLLPASPGELRVFLAREEAQERAVELCPDLFCSLSNRSYSCFSSCLVMNRAPKSISQPLLRVRAYGASEDRYFQHRAALIRKNKPLRLSRTLLLRLS